jgi:hypothetical protein
MDTWRVIRDAVIHLSGKLPLLADLHAVPGPTDLTVLCTNLRTRDGKRPTFVEDTQAWFVIPMREVTIIELPIGGVDPRSGEEIEAAPLTGRELTVSTAADEASDDEDDSSLEPDEDLLARIRQL